MPPAIRVDDLGKRYRLGQSHARSLRDVINSAAGRLLGRRNSHTHAPKPSTGDPSQMDDEGYFWALKDVSFEVQPGEVVGIIGRNGAGKSTLLKILSNIVSPTTGHIALHGRVASLLEVGTGFHPELTGRENVFLNGAILGMTKSEVRRKFDEIVDFAGVEQFIDTPVKRYSSGMTVRLAFAVAAYLESEILIIDEVLAVGDVEFQRKCLGKMQAVSSSGRTVLFVSHNMASVRTLTSRSLVLSRGMLVYGGPTSDAMNRYIDENASSRVTATSVAEFDRPFGGLSGEINFDTLEMEQSEPLVEGTQLVICIGVRGKQAAKEFLVGLTFFRQDGSPVGSTFSAPLSAPSVEERRCYRLCLSTGQLAPGRYHCAISLAEVRSDGRRLIDSLDDVLHFEIEPGPLQGRGWPAIWGPIRFANMRLLNADSVVDSAPSVMLATAE
jgi:lipopolysaccharide transport system ATP-binding protein